MLGMGTAFPNSEDHSAGTCTTQHLLIDMKWGNFIFKKFFFLQKKSRRKTLYIVVVMVIVVIAVSLIIYAIAS